VAEVINFKRHRRARDQAEAAAKAAENRVLHGRTKAERERDRLQAEQDQRRLDMLRRDDR
jgi:hypothetical protein